MLPDKSKFVKCSIISLVLSFWMKHLVIGQLQKPAKFSAILKSGFHWSAFGNQQGSTFTGRTYSPYRMLNYPIGTQGTYSCPSFNQF